MNEKPEIDTEPSAAPETQRRKLDSVLGTSWGYQDGMVRLQLWPERCLEPYSIWMSPGQVMELIEQGARTARLALKGSL